MLIRFCVVFESESIVQTGHIYCIKNLINGRMYIGQSTKSPKSRKRGHHQAAVLGSMQAIHCAIRKYGKDSFEWSVMFEGLDADSLNVYEIAMIRKFNTLSPNGYNLRAGGECGGKCSDETRKKFSENARKQFESPAAREYLSQRGKEVNGTPEARARVSLQFKGKKRTEASIQKMIKATTGTKRSVKARMNIANSTINRPPVSEATKQKLRAINLGKKHNDEAKEKCRISSTGRLQSEETKAKRRVSCKFYHEVKKPQLPWWDYIPTAFV